jgi:glycopeptide antibiotics resistance protein
MEDKLLHFGGSFIIALMITFTIPDILDLAIIALFCLLGIVFEFWQESTGQGVFEMADVIANCLGAFFGFIITKLALEKRKRRRDRDYWGG